LLRRASELAPANARIIRNVAILAGVQGRVGEAIELLRRAATLDPLAVPVQRSLVRWYWAAGLLEGVESAMKKMSELDPKGGRAHHYLGLVRLTQGRPDEALEEFLHEQSQAFVTFGVALAQHARGHAAESEAALQELIEKSAADAAYQIAEVYAYRGQPDLAFEWLERAYVQRDAGLVLGKVSPLLRNLHADPRWPRFLEKLGLAD